MINKELLNDLFSYKEGQLFYKKKTAICTIIGKRAGNIRKDEYCQIKVKGKIYLEHRLIFCMFNGYMPERIDHISDKLTGEGIKSNKIENLRETTQSANIQKQRKRKKATSKYLGVHFCSKNKKWISQIMIDYKKYHIGTFKTEEEAMLAYKEKVSLCDSLFKD